MAPETRSIALGNFNSIASFMGIITMLLFGEYEKIIFKRNYCLFITYIIFSTLIGIVGFAAHAGPQEGAAMDAGQAAGLGVVQRYQALEDSGCALHLEAARSSQHWIAVADRSPNFGFTSACWWIRFNLDNSGRQPAQVTVDLGTPLQDFVDWHVLDRSDGRLLTSVRSGDRRDFNFRYQQSLTLALPLAMAAGQQLAVYARLATFDGFQEPLALAVRSSDAFSLAKSRELLLTGMYFGCLLAFCIYSIFLFISTKENIHITYAAFLLLLSLTTFIYYGASTGLLHSINADFNNALLPFFFSLCMFFFFIFARTYLKIPDLPPNILIETYNVIITLLLLISPLAFLLGYAIAYAANATLVLCNILILLLLTIRLCWKKNMNAIFLFIAFFPLGTSLSLKLLSLDNFITVQHLIENNFYLAESTIFSVVALSFSIAHSMKIMRLAMEKARSRELESTIALQDNELKLLHLSRVTLAGELSGAIAHELSQPLTSILSNAQAAEFMIRNRHFNESAQLAITRDIIDQAKLAATVIAKIRKLLYPGKRSTDRIRVNDVLASARLFLQHDLTLKNIRLTEYGDHALHVSGDLVQIQQVMINLLANAIEAVKDLPDERKCVYLSVRAYLGKYALFTISDTGVGLPPDQHDRIFDAFFTTKEGGMGLGLNICKKIIVAHYGEIWARSSYPFGSIIEFTLPTDE
ncbi:sensor histidine kinase [Janthinobacterium sp. 1_2014MBL_MicDiv]|uniref:sensor histidine kinase n=1 Tax=Janthinobacterium sp. 1_2014MBL_MicDiv TaxID=1644131 RepID=UPI0012EB5D33|nr:sensor histidine kinase [Janthinobacterium sp. 1_2014MBL_MicDiv]